MSENETSFEEAISDKNRGQILVLADGGIALILSKNVAVYVMADGSLRPSGPIGEGIPSMLLTAESSKAILAGLAEGLGGIRSLLLPA